MYVRLIILSLRYLKAVISVASRPRDGSANVKLETERDYWQTIQRLLQHAVRLKYRLL